MALTKKSWQDHLTASFGQESETARASKDGLTIGGVYNATPPTIADGEFSRAQVDASGNLMVNVAAGEVVAVSAGTITAGTINAGTITAGTINAGTITAGTIDVMKLGTVVGSWASFRGTVTIPTSDTVTSGTTASTIGGIVRGLTVQTPDMTATNATTFKLLDTLGGTIISSGAQAESAITYYGTTQVVTTSMNWVATSAGTESAAKDIVFVAHYEK